MENFSFWSDSFNRTAMYNSHDDRGAPDSRRESKRMIFVNIGVPDLDMTEHWDALARRAPANVFLNPAALNAAAATGFAQVHALLAWDTGVAPNKLVGF